MVVGERMEKSTQSIPGALALGKGWLVSLRPTLSTGWVGSSKENFLHGGRDGTQIRVCNYENMYAVL